MKYLDVKIKEKMTARQKITSLVETIEYFKETLKAHPERDILAAEKAVIEGKRRRYPVITINHPARPDDDYVALSESELPKVDVAPGPEGDLAREIIAKLEPLKIMNPIRACFDLGQGPGTLATCFGIPLNPDADNTPAYTKTLDEILAEPIPDPRNSGLLPEIKKRVKFLKDNTPEWFKISMPDTQGPYNLVHALIGEEALTAPYTASEKFRELMEQITDFWIEAVKNLKRWIGKERLTSWNQCLTRICECSVNLISAGMYKEYILPSDIRIAKAFGFVDVHTCSGPHVFHITLENIPDIAATEAGFIKCATAGYTPVEEAMRVIGARPIVLRIGQELTPGREFEVIKNDIDIYEHNPRILFSYTGMSWLKKDRPAIRELHRKVDDYWEMKYGSILL